MATAGPFGLAVAPGSPTFFVLFQGLTPLATHLCPSRAGSPQGLGNSKSSVQPQASQNRAVVVYTFTSSV